MPNKPFDRDDHFSGQTYAPDEEGKLGDDMPAGSVSPEPPRTGATLDDEPDNGRRASFDPRTGAVHGSGSGAGGGNVGEDPDDDPSGGDG